MSNAREPGPHRGAQSMAEDAQSHDGIPDAGASDVGVPVVRADAGIADLLTSLPDLLAVADTLPKGAPDVRADVGAPDLLALPDLRSALPEAGPEALKCSPLCNTGCNIGCRSDGQCTACATCTCEVASGTCHC